MYLIENIMVRKFSTERIMEKKGSSAEFVGNAKGVAHPAPNLLRDMWANTDPGTGGTGCGSRVF
jgi:hypothetical protein